jgi:hypothetical protein
LFRLVAEVAEGVQEAADREVRLEVRGPDAGALMTGDEDRLKTAFTDILRAILREKLGPCIVAVDRRLVADNGDRSAVIVVAETAAVQAAYDAPAGPFDEKRGGVGLSLPLARRVIEAHRGRLWSPAVADSGAAAPAAPVAFDQRAARATALIAIPLGS